MLIVFLSTALTQAAAVPLIDDAAKRLSIQMEDVTAASGIDFVTTSGATPSSQIMEVKGGGIAIIDMDNDGDLDLFFPNGSLLGQPSNGPGARLYENLGGMRFRDVTASSGIDHHAWSFGCAVGDYDADGLDDILYCMPWT